MTTRSSVLHTRVDPELAAELEILAGLCKGTVAQVVRQALAVCVQRYRPQIAAAQARRRGAARAGRATPDRRPSAPAGVGLTSPDQRAHDALERLRKAYEDR